MAATTCPHYRRRCQVLAACCDQWVGCRLCHDEKYGEQHKIDRFAIQWMCCNLCLTVQRVVIVSYFVCSHRRIDSSNMCCSALGRVPLAMSTWLRTFVPCVICSMTRGWRSACSTVTNAAFVGTALACERGAVVLCG